MFKIKTLLLTALMLTLTGCTFGRNKVDYSSLGPELHIKTDKSIAVAVYDMRPYVLSEEKKNTFVGVTRGTYYNSFDMSTVSGSALAADLQRSVLSALANSNIVASTKTFDPPLKAGSSNQRLLVLKINEWKTDTYLSTQFVYDMNASVIDENGKVLGTQHARNDEQIQNFQDSGMQALKDLLASPQIIRALTANP